MKPSQIQTRAPAPRAHGHFFSTRATQIPNPIWNPHLKEELDECNRYVQIVISNAQWWRNDLERILEISRADIESLDPEGVNFSFRFSPPPKFNPFPVISGNSSGFILVMNKTLSVTLSSENYKFIVENGTWFSNFTYSLYVNDVSGNSYLIVFNPPSQEYSVELKNETSIALKNFAIANGEVKLSDAGKTFGKRILFSVVGFQVDPKSIRVTQPENTQFMLVLIFSFLVFSAVLAYVLLRKRV